MKRSLPLFVVPVAVGIVMAGPGSAQAAGPSLVRTEAQAPVSENWVDHAVTPSVAADTGIPGINSFDAEFVWGNRTEMLSATVVVTRGVLRVIADLTGVHAAAPSADH